MSVVSHPRDVDIQETVAVVIGNHRHAAPGTAGNPGHLRDICEAPRAVVAKESIAALDRGDEEVSIAIVVEVEKDHAARGVRIGFREAGVRGCIRILTVA